MRIGIFIDRDSRQSEDISIEASVKEEVLLHELRRRYDLQQTEIEIANTKAGIVLAYLASACCCILAIRPARSYSPLATERDEIEEYLALTREAMVMQILVQYSHFIQQNFKIVQFKNRWLIRALILSLVFISTLVSVKAAVAILP